jgi:hypothetical protein
VGGLDKKLAVVTLIAVASLVIAIVALSDSYVIISEYHQSPASTTPTLSPQTTLFPTTTPQPTVTPTAVAPPNLSSAKPDSGNPHISIAIDLYNDGYFPTQYDPEYNINVTNTSTLPITVYSIVYTDPLVSSNETYWIGNQVLAPHATTTFINGNVGETSQLFIYYKVSSQLFYYTQTYNPTIP